MTTIVQTITDLDTPPAKTDPVNFDFRADRFFTQLDDLAEEINIWTGQVNAVAVEVNTNASIAESAKNAAISAVGISAWATGTACSTGDTVYGSDGHSYRAIQPSTGVNPVDDDGTYWTRLTGSDGLIPGVIMPFTGTIAAGRPYNRMTGASDMRYALCDGNTYTSPDGVSVTTPDLSDKFIRGKGSDSDIGDTGGAETHSHSGSVSSAGSHSHSVSVSGHTLTQAEMPSHSHSFSGSTNTNGHHTHTPSLTGNSGSGLTRALEWQSTSDSGYSDLTTGGTIAGAGGHSHTLSGSIGSSGSGGSHNHGASAGSAGSHTHSVTVSDGTSMPPYYVTAWIMKL